MKMYLAGPCDSEHRTMMVGVAKYLRDKNNEVYCPWELKIENAWDMPQEEWAKKVFDADIAAIDNAELVLAISLGRISSAGTNWEMGYAYGKGIPVHVIQITDKPTSLMTYCGCTSFINVSQKGNLQSALNWILENPTEASYNTCKTVLT